VPLIRVSMFPGRNPSQKAELVRRLTDAFLDACGLPGQTAEAVWVLIDEVPRDQWGVGGEVGTP
jgi:4-oxalocrotonate tautomerase